MWKHEGRREKNGNDAHAYGIKSPFWGFSPNKPMFFARAIGPAAELALFLFTGTGDVHDHKRH